MPTPLTSRKNPEENTLITIGELTLGGNAIVIIAGPCAVESAEQIQAAAREVSQAGLKILRAGAFKPRTNPYAFQGMGEEGLSLLRAAADETGLAVVTEVMDTRDVERVAYYADILQIGSRNMQNFSLLKEVGKTRKPILLKRGMSATLKEFLLAAEYIMNEGNLQVILCERGIRTFETENRNTLDINAIPSLKALTHLPVIVDPSHATGKSALVPAVARAAIAAGADGLLIEMHPDPATALCDGEQALTPTQLKHLLIELRAVTHAVGRTL